MRRRALAVLATATAALVTAASAAAATVTVTPAHMNGWAAVNDTCGGASTGSVSFVSGPATPPAGSGSAKFTVGANGDSYPTLRTDDYNGVKLSDLTALDYWTYVSSAPGSQAAYLDLYVDWNGDNVQDDTITFEPVYNGTVTPNTWQHWNALTGNWWSDAMGGPPPFFTLSTYGHPNATILGGSDENFVLAAGCGGTAWTNFVGNADKLTIGVNGSNTTYDFEPTVGPPTNKNQCKHGGWKDFNNPSFKNQGQCVSHVNHGGKHDNGKHHGKGHKGKKK
jgi:hypothetical protein